MMDLGSIRSEAMGSADSRHSEVVSALLSYLDGNQEGCSYARWLPVYIEHKFKARRLEFQAERDHMVGSQEYYRLVNQSRREVLDAQNARLQAYHQPCRHCIVCKSRVKGWPDPRSLLVNHGS